MTDFYGYDSRPERITIRCPRCTSPAEFRFPFSLLERKKYEQFKEQMWPGAKTSTWGSSYLIEHDPNLYRWNPSSQGSGYSRNNNDGIRMCARCIGRFKHKLNWSADAYFSFELKEGLLWAWTLGHAEELADFIESKERNAQQYRYNLFLRHIPSVFLDRRCRNRVVRSIRIEIDRLTKHLM